MAAHVKRQLFARFIPRNHFAQSVSILVGGTALAQILGILAAPVLTRIYRPTDFGALQVFISLMSLLTVGATGRYEIAVLLPDDEQSAVDILALSLLCVGSTALLCGVAVAICHYRWILPSNMLALRGLLWLLPFSIIGSGVYQTLSYWAMRRNDYTQIAKSKFTQAAAQVATQAGTGWVIHGSFGLLLGDALGRVSGSGRFARDLWRGYENQLRAVRPGRMFRLAVRYREYPLVSMWGTLINMSGLALPALFLAQYYGPRETGCFGLVYRVLGAPISLVGVSIAQVYIAEAAKLSRSDPARLMHIFFKTTRHMIYLGLVPCGVFAVLAPWLFVHVFGHAWLEAGEYARYMSFMFYAGFINSPVTQTLNVLERQRAQFAWDISRLIVTLSAIAIPHRLGYGAGTAVLAYGIAMSLMYAVHWTQSYFGISRCVRLSVHPLAGEAPA
jgi:O-antigen/teichoic acid export membrane protein